MPDTANTGLAGRLSVTITWDESACLWRASSDVMPGLTASAPTIAALGRDVDGQVEFICAARRQKHDEARQREREFQSGQAVPLAPPKRFMDTHDAAEYLTSIGLSCASQTLRNKRVAGNGPLFHKRGHNVIYKVEDLDAWAEQTISPPMENTAQSAAYRRTR